MMPLNSNQNPSIDGAALRQALLLTIQKYSGNRASLQPGQIITKAVEDYPIGSDPDTEEALLTLLHDLFRTGHLAWGQDMTNAAPPYFHITEQGRRALEHLSHDPANPDGYLNYLRTIVNLNPISASYIEEALRTYNSDCLKATAVMVGCATESLTLELRDALVAKKNTISMSVHDDFNHRQISRVLNAISKDLDAKTGTMSDSLRQAYGTYWSAFTGHIRIARNEAGHPSSLEPVTHETVHSSLLMFPICAKLAADLREWIATSYS